MKGFTKKQKLFCSLFFFSLFILLLLLVRTVDVRPIGPEGTKIGLSHLNEAFSRRIGVHIRLYQMTDWLGLVAIAVAFSFGMLGLVQLLKRKSICKVDAEILILGGVYLFIFCLYLLFEFAVVNYRPILMPGATRPEASFPSSHTMLVCVIMGSAATLVKRYFSSPRLCRILQAFCFGMIALTVPGRLFSGVHWLTDILASVFISTALLCFFSAVIEKK